MTSDLDVLCMHGKIRRESFQCNWYHGQLKSESSAIIETKSLSSTHKNIIFPFHKTSSLALAYTHKHEIILFHNTLMTNLSITYIFLPCLCLVSLFLSNLSKLHLFTFHICFQFRIQDHLAFKLTHKMRQPPIWMFFYMYGKIRR
jgi:hypothetical protein